MQTHEFLSIMESRIQNGTDRSAKSSDNRQFIALQRIGNPFVLRGGIRVTLSLKRVFSHTDDIHPIILTSYSHIKNRAREQKGEYYD